MKTLLTIKSSIYGETGQSSKLVDAYAAEFRRQQPGARVVARDLAAAPPPHLTAERFAAFAAPAASRDAGQHAVVDYSDALIGELREADVIAFGVPMYNFSVPSTLRAYFDHVGRAGVTFRYSDSGPEGLLTGKRAVAFMTRGGHYEGELDTQAPYLRQFLGFIGITDLELVIADRLAFGETIRAASLAAARMPAAA